MLGGSALRAGAEDIAVYRNRVDEKMSYAKLGRTNLMVSRLSLGGSPFQPDMGVAALDLGVNLFHGALGYRCMEAQAQAFKGKWDRIWYAMKATTPDEFNKGLQTLGVDHVAFVMAVFTKADGVGSPQVKEAFDTLKQQGKLDYLGITCHADPQDLPKIVQAATQAGFYDAILTMYQPALAETLDPLLAQARQAGIGTLSMKTLQGAPGDPAGAAKVIGSALGRGKIDTVLKAIGNTNQLEAFAAAAQSAQARLDTDELRRFRDWTACGACGACTECPQRVAIRDILRCETYYARIEGLQSHAREVYRSLPADRTVAACLDCGTCERQCPRGLPVRKLLKAAQERWG
jgi:predicted aldo/keto reductase-like oxidoreductase